MPWIRPTICSIWASACSAVILPFSASLADLALGDVAGLVEACLHERVVDVLEHYGDARGGDRLGDLAAHRPGAHDGGFEHEHAGWLSSAD